MSTMKEWNNPSDSRAHFLQLYSENFSLVVVEILISNSYLRRGWNGVEIATDILFFTNQKKFFNSCALQQKRVPIGRGAVREYRNSIREKKKSDDEGGC
jgi:hypothetical protein